MLERAMAQANELRRTASRPAISIAYHPHFDDRLNGMASPICTTMRRCNPVAHFPTSRLPQWVPEQTLAEQCGAPFAWML